MFKILVVITAGGGYGESTNIQVSTTVIEFKTEDAAIRAASAINQCRTVNGNAICLW